MLAVILLVHKLYYINSKNTYNYVFYSKLRDLLSFNPVMLLHDLYDFRSCVLVLLCMYQCFWSGMVVHGNNSSIRDLLMYVLCFAYDINHLLYTEIFKLFFHADFYFYSWYEKRYAQVYTYR